MIFCGLLNKKFLKLTSTCCKAYMNMNQILWLDRTRKTNPTMIKNSTQLAIALMRLKVNFLLKVEEMVKKRSWKAVSPQVIICKISTLFNFIWVSVINVIMANYCQLTINKLTTHESPFDHKIICKINLWQTLTQ